MPWLTVLALPWLFGCSGLLPRPPAVRWTLEDNVRQEDPSIQWVSGRSRDCDAEQIACFSACWTKKPPYPYQQGKADHYQYCNTTCLKAYMKCLKDTGLHPLQFPAIQDAQQWMDRHREELLAGTVIVVAGAAMVVVTVETGGLALIPLLAL